MASKKNGRAPDTASIYVPGCVAPIVVHRNGRDLWQDGHKLPIHHNKASGYAYTNIRVFGGNGKTKYLTYSVHKLVALAFLGRKAPDQEVDHINRNRADNRACNLRWVSHRENSRRLGTRRAISRAVRVAKRGSYAGGLYYYRSAPIDGVSLVDIPSYAESVSEASRETGVPTSIIYKVLRGCYGYKSARGFGFTMDLDNIDEKYWKNIEDLPAMETTEQHYNNTFNGGQDIDGVDELDLYDPEHPDLDPIPSFATA